MGGPEDVGDAIAHHHAIGELLCQRGARRLGERADAGDRHVRACCGDYPIEALTAGTDERTAEERDARGVTGAAAIVARRAALAIGPRLDESVPQWAAAATASVDSSTSTSGR